MLLDTLTPLWAEVSPALTNYREQAKRLRDSQEPPSIDETPGQIHGRIVNTRIALDELETILADVGLVRSRVEQAVAEAQEAYDDQWRATMERTQIGEYSSAQERNATYTTGAVDELIKLRRAKKLLAEVKEVYDFCQIKYRGLDAARIDTINRAKLFNITGYLES